MKLVPLFDRVVLKQLVAEETTKSGIVLPGQAKEKPQQAEVIAVGPGGVVDGKEITMQVKAGDKVIFSKYSGTDVEVEDEKEIREYKVEQLRFKPRRKKERVHVQDDELKKLEALEKKEGKSKLDDD